MCVGVYTRVIKLILQSRIATHQEKKKKMDGMPEDIRRLYKLCKEGNLKEVKEITEEIGKEAFVERLKVHKKELWYVNTPLHEAAAKGYEDMLSYLLELGCDVNCRSLEGETPLHLAVRNGHVGCIRAMLKHKPDLSVRNNSGKTPRQVAELRPAGCCIEGILRSEGTKYAPNYM